MAGSGLATLLTRFLYPDRRALTFASRGLIAMALALFIATYLGLDRPYWALISAVFLQIRPETGLVIEKGICQVLGTLAGGAVGVVILAWLMPYPLLIVAVLALWVGANAFVSALLRRLNLVYGFAIAGITAVLVVMLTLITAADAGTAPIFAVAGARVGEIVIGAVCATLAATLLWRVQVKDALLRQARGGINLLLDYMALELSPASPGTKRHGTADSVLQAIIALNDDSSAAVFEGRGGPGRARAATRLCHKALSLMAVIQVFGRFRRRHRELISVELDAALEAVRDGLQRMRCAGSEAEARRIAQALRRELQAYPRAPEQALPIQRRLFRMAREMVGDTIVVLEAYRAIESSDQALLKAPQLAPYRDPLSAAIIGFRATLLYLIGAAAWLATGSPAAVVLMILPVIFSIVFARLPSPPAAMRRLLTGALVAVPVALVLGLVLKPLAMLPQGFVLTVAIFSVPLFFGLIAMADPPTRHYGVGFAIPYILLIQPSSEMTFALGRFAGTAGALIVALVIVYLVFRLVNVPSARLIQRRLVVSTTRDLERLGKPQSRDAEDWFNAQMAERLMRLSAYDRALPEDERHLTDLGLTGLNLGHTALRLQRQLAEDSDPQVHTRARQWQAALAAAYYRASTGGYTGAFRRYGARLLAALRRSGQLDEARLERIEGTLERLALTFERLAGTVPGAGSNDNQPPSADAVGGRGGTSQRPGPPEP